MLWWKRTELKGHGKLSLKGFYWNCQAIRGRPFNSWGGRGGWFWKKNSRERLSEEKNCMQHKCHKKLMGKKGKKISCPPDCYKKNSWWPEITPPPPPQELNGRPLTVLVLVFGWGGTGSQHGGWHREEKSLRHVAMVAKCLDLNKLCSCRCERKKRKSRHVWHSCTWLLSRKEIVARTFHPSFDNRQMVVSDKKDCWGPENLLPW